MGTKTPNVRAGKLRVRMYLQAHDGTQTTRGQRDNSDQYWGTVATLWGGIETLAGGELEIAQKLFAEATHRVEIRYRAGVTAQHRLKVKADGRKLHIGHVNNWQQRNRKLFLTVREEV
jgi:SPP1 family predicted phage head-tail adaptor